MSSMTSTADASHYGVLPTYTSGSGTTTDVKMVTIWKASLPSPPPCPPVSLHRNDDGQVRLQVGAAFWMTPERALELAAHLVAYAEAYAARSFDDVLDMVNEA